MHRPTDIRASGSSPARTHIVQVLCTFGMASLLMLAIAHMKPEATDAPAGEQTRVAGIAAADLERELVTPRSITPTRTPQASDQVWQAAAARSSPPRRSNPAAPPASTVAMDPGPPLPLVPPRQQETDSLVAGAGKTGLTALKNSADFVTRTVPRAVVDTTREAVAAAKSIAAAVLDRVTP